MEMESSEQLHSCQVRYTTISRTATYTGSQFVAGQLQNNSHICYAHFIHDRLRNEVNCYGSMITMSALSHAHTKLAIHNYAVFECLCWGLKVG